MMTKRKPTELAATKNRTPTLDAQFEAIAALFSTDPDVGRRKLFGSNHVLSVKGKIFAMVVKGALVAKLPKPRVDELVRAGAGVNFDPGHGRLMKEWVAVPEGGGDWPALAREAHRFVSGAR